MHVDVHSVWVAHRGLLYRLLTEALWYWLHVDVHAAWVAHRGTLVVVACGCALCIGCPQRPSVIGCMWMCILYGLPTEALCNSLHVDVHSVWVAHRGPEAEQRT